MQKSNNKLADLSVAFAAEILIVNLYEGCRAAADASLHSPVGSCCGLRRTALRRSALSRAAPRRISLSRPVSGEKRQRLRR